MEKKRQTKGNEITSSRGGWGKADSCVELLSVELSVLAACRIETAVCVYLGAETRRAPNKADTSSSSSSS